jgi:hypothetical protein
MHANASNIWHVPAYLPYVQQPLTREAVRDTETRIGFKLPQELIELFSEQNSVIAVVQELGIQCAPLDPARAFEDVPNMPH